MTKTSIPEQLAREEQALIEAGFAVQRQSLELLLAEMRALSALIPAAHCDQTPAEAAAEIEDGFDNMPV